MSWTGTCTWAPSACPAPTTSRKDRLATAYVRPHDIRIATNGHSDPDPAAVKATIERITSLGWLARIGLRLPDDQILIAHIPQEELSGATVGDVVTVDLRNTKAFQREEAEEVVPAT